jgi:transcriptional regulator of acetoin/glycerol metabolism
MGATRKGSGMIDDDHSTARHGATALEHRGEILESWRRSRLNGVDREGADPVEGRIDAEWRVSRIAIPVLEATAQMLIGSNTSLLLSAPDGTMLWRWDEDSSLKRLLDRNSAVVGTRWSEDVVGTNGLGTALETSKPITVSGAEHYCEALHPFTCAGAPIRHPVTRRVTGVLSVTSLVKDESPLMGPTLLRLARDIEQELYGDSSQHEREMLQQFLAERRRLRAAVVAVSSEVFIANAAAAGLPLDRSDLWQRIENDPGSIVGWRLGEDCTVTSMRPVMRGSELVGAVLVAADGAEQRPRRTAPVDDSWDAHVPVARRALERRRRVIIAGESGVGKRELARRALAADAPIGEIDCTEVEELGPARWLARSREVLAAGSSVLIARIDLLDDRVAHSLASILDRAAPPDTRVAATVELDGGGGAAGSRVLLDRFPPELVEMAPLRRRPDDIRRRLADHRLGRARLTRQAADALRQYPWPGNDRQLEQFRRWLDDQVRAVVDLADLPPDWSSAAARRRLSTIQLAECDAIAGALREHGRNKSAAAAALGISRSSLYRKMREYHLAAD